MRRIDWYQNRRILISGSQDITIKVIFKVDIGIMAIEILQCTATSCEPSIRIMKFWHHSIRLIETNRMVPKSCDFDRYFSIYQNLTKISCAKQILKLT